MILFMGYLKMSKAVFVTIGYIEWRKGQDVLIEAIENLPQHILAETEFLFVGQDSSVMAHELKKKVANIPNVKICGTVSRMEIHNILGNCSMLVCPSREDPMPTVCAEAMMHHVPCIVSDSTGTSDYIKDGNDGFVFKSEDVKELSQKIQWCVEHKDKLQEMGDRAYHIYESFFSEKAFEDKLLGYVEEMIGKAQV